MWWQARLPSTSTILYVEEGRYSTTMVMPVWVCVSCIPSFQIPRAYSPSTPLVMLGSHHSPSSPLLPRQRSAGEPCQPRSQSVSVSRYRGRRGSPTPTSVGLYAQDSKTAPSLLVARHNLPLSDLIYAILRTEKHRSDIQYDAGRSAAGDQTLHIRQQARHPGGTPRSIKLAVSACAVYRLRYPSQYLVSLPMLPDPRCTSRRHWTKPTRLLHCQFHQ